MTTATAQTQATINIVGHDYGVEILPISPLTVRLTGTKGQVYDVTEGADRATCDCPSYTHGVAGNTAVGCKHIQACVRDGLIVNNALDPWTVFRQPSDFYPRGENLPPTQATQFPIQESPTIVSEPVSAIDDAPTVRVAESTPAVKPVARKRQSWDHVDFAALAARVASGASLVDLSAETGIPKSTLSYRIRKLTHDASRDQGTQSQIADDSDRAWEESWSVVEDSPKLGDGRFFVIASETHGTRVDAAPSACRFTVEVSQGILLISPELPTDDDRPTPPTGTDPVKTQSRSAVILGTTLRTATIRPTGPCGLVGGLGLARAGFGRQRVSDRIRKVRVKVDHALSRRRNLVVGFDLDCLGRRGIGIGLESNVIGAGQGDIDGIGGRLLGLVRQGLL